MDIKMQVQRVRNNNCNIQFNGTLRFYNFNKNKWFYKRTTKKEDKILYDLFKKYCPMDLTKETCNGYDKFVGKMKYSNVLDYIADFPRLIGFDLPTIISKANANITEYNVPNFFDGRLKKQRSMVGYKMYLVKTFKISHWFDKQELVKKNL